MNGAGLSTRVLRTKDRPGRAPEVQRPAAYTAALEVAGRLAQSTDAAPRWVGKDALRELASAKVPSRLAST